MLLGGLLAVLLATVVLTPGPLGVSLGSLELPATCSFRALTGIRCPGCGLTRSFVYMGHLQVMEAFRMHLAGPPLYGLAVWLAAVRVVRLARALRERRRG